MKPVQPHPFSPPALSKVDLDALNDLYARGTPENTLRAYERDLAYLTAWKRLRFNEPLVSDCPAEYLPRFPERRLPCRIGLSPVRK